MAHAELAARAALRVDFRLALAVELGDARALQHRRALAHGDALADLRGPRRGPRRGAQRAVLAARRRLGAARLVALLRGRVRVLGRLLGRVGLADALREGLEGLGGRAVLDLGHEGLDRAPRVLAPRVVPDGPQHDVADEQQDRPQLRVEDELGDEGADAQGLGQHDGPAAGRALGRLRARGDELALALELLVELRVLALGAARLLGLAPAPRRRAGPVHELARLARAGQARPARELRGAQGLVVADRVAVDVHARVGARVGVDEGLERDELGPGLQIRARGRGDLLVEHLQIAPVEERDRERRVVVDLGRLVPVAVDDDRRDVGQIHERLGRAPPEHGDLCGNQPPVRDVPTKL